MRDGHGGKGWMRGAGRGCVILRIRALGARGMSWW
jgi:hypothetical protein